jgi:hypothetical protein
MAPAVARLDVSTSDPYSGMKSIEVKVDGVRKHYVEEPCSGGCPTSRATSWTYRAADYTPGTHTITVTAKDQLGAGGDGRHVTTTTWQVDGDDQPPDVALEGTLWEADEAVVSDPSYDLHIDSGDGTADEPGVGVKSIEVTVDGQQKLFASQSCPDGACQLDRTFTFNTASYSEGAHDIDVKVLDQIGNESIDSESVIVDHVPSQPPKSTTTDSSDGRSGGTQPEGQAGRSVASVGDLNGDGFSDYAVGAPGESPGGLLNAGSVYVVYGSANTAPSELGTSGYRIDGAFAGDRAGTAVAGAGDINGDGLADLAIGAPAGPARAGHVYVVFGAPGSGNLTLGALGTRGFAITGPVLPALPLDNAERSFGSSLAGPGTGIWQPRADVNDDGFDDLVIGSSIEDASGRPGAGVAYVVFGKADVAPIDVTALGSNGFVIGGGAAGDAAGAASSVVGDVNGDDYADVVVAAPGADAAGRTEAGKAYVVFGKPGATAVDLAALGPAGGFEVHGATADRLGSSVAALGDVNEDSLQDFAVGGHGGFVVLGRDYTDAEDFAAPANGFRLAPPAGTEYDGSVVASARDLNADGLPDVAVGFPAAQGGAGRVWALFSKRGFSFSPANVDLATLGGERGASVSGAAAGNRAGSGLAAIDRGADGNPALLIGSPGATNGLALSAGAVDPVPVPELLPPDEQPPPEQPPPPQQPPPGYALRNGCYEETEPAYPYRIAEDFPECRLTERSNREKTLRGVKTGWRGQARDQKQAHYGGNTRATFRNGKRLNGNAVTPFYDSDGTLVGHLRQVKKRPYRFVLYDRDKKLVKEAPTNALLEMEFEGTPCMTSASGRSPGDYALFSMQDHRAAKGGSSGPIAGLRAIVHRGMLPPNAFSKSRSNDRVIGAGWLPCNKPSGFDKGVNGGPAHTITYTAPGFVKGQDRYQGSGAASSCRKNHVRQWDPQCGTNYVNYIYPRDPDPAFTSFPKLVFGSASSTGITKGGIVRAIFAVPGTGLQQVVRRDGIKYFDHNLPCGSQAAAKWSLLDYKRVYTWLAIRNKDQPPDQQDPYVRSRATGSDFGGEEHCPN